MLWICPILNNTSKYVVKLSSSVSNPQILIYESGTLAIELQHCFLFTFGG